MSKKPLKGRIQEEMTEDGGGALERNFNATKQFLRVSKTGSVNVLVNDGVNGEDRIALYLVGKKYAKEAGYSPTDEVDSEELQLQLQIKEGSLRPWLASLRDAGLVKRVPPKDGQKVRHSVNVNQIDTILRLVEKKVRAWKQKS